MKEGKRIWLLLVCVMSFGFVDAQVEVYRKDLFRMAPETIKGEKLPFNKGGNVGESLILISGKDCVECLYFIVDEHKGKQIKFSFVYLTDDELAPIQKRNIISGIQKRDKGRLSEQVTDQNIYFLRRDNLTENRGDKLPEVIRLYEENATYISYRTIWQAMQLEKELDL